MNASSVVSTIPNEVIEWLRNAAILWGIYTGQYTNRSFTYSYDDGYSPF
jgi:hypothetical protein